MCLRFNNIIAAVEAKRNALKFRVESPFRITVDCVRSTIYIDNQLRAADGAGQTELVRHGHPPPLTWVFWQSQSLLARKNGSQIDIDYRMPEIGGYVES